MSERIKKVLGLDLGTASIGWALIELTETEIQDDQGTKDKNYLLDDFKILDGGVRIFKEMMDKKKGEPLNASRRTKRGIRKLVARKRRRLKKLLLTLDKMGITSQDIHKESLFKSFIDQFKTLEDPYFLRKKALDKKLEPLELARVLYHIAKRRGFRSARKNPDDRSKAIEKIQEGLKTKAEAQGMSLEDYAVKHLASKDDNDDNKVLEGIELLNVLVNKSGERTLGEFFYHFSKKDPDFKIRGRYLDRTLLEKEFAQIIEKQSTFYPQLKEKKIISKYESFWGDLKPVNTNQDLLKDIIFEPRPLKDQSKLIGKCPYFIDEQRLQKSSLVFQEFELRSKLNNIKIGSENEKGLVNFSEARNLTQEEKEQVFQEIFFRTETTWKKIRTLLKLKNTDIFNYERGSSQKEKLKGSSTYFNLRECFGEEKLAPLFAEHQKDPKKSWLEKIIYLYNKSESTLYKELPKLLAEKNITDPAIENNLKSTDLKYSHTYGSYGKTMVLLMLPLIKDGVEVENDKKNKQQEEISFKEYHFIKHLEKEGKIKTEKEGKGRLLNPQEIELITFNPRVKKMLFELRRIFKALEKKYGAEDMQKNWLYRIEMARDMKKDEYNRNFVSEAQNFNQKMREKAREQYPDKKLSREDENKYILWRETKESCAYCENPIKQSDLLSNATEIDHIIPISRISDDSMQNKVISCRSCNQEKTNKTPYEAFSNTPKWDKMLNKLASITLEKTKAYKDNKSQIDDDKRVLMNYSKFLRIQWGEEEVQKAKGQFSSRQLNETRFGSKEAVKFIEKYRGNLEPDRTVSYKYEKRKIFTTKGGFTHRIKSLLKLNTNQVVESADAPTDSDKVLTQGTPLLFAEYSAKQTKTALEAEPQTEAANSPAKPQGKKQRSDHRHHFVDALAIAFISPSFENRASTINTAEASLKRHLKDIYKNKDDADLLKNFHEKTSEEREAILEKIEKKINETQKSDKQGQFWRKQFLKYLRIMDHQTVQKKNGKTNLSNMYEEIIEKLQKDLPSFLANMVVSHGVNKKILGGLHQETCFGVLKTLPVSFLDKERFAKLLKDKYISKDVHEKVQDYINEHEFLDLQKGKLQKEKADNPLLYAFRRGNRKKGSYPPALNMHEFWDEAKHGAFKTDHLPLEKPIYTKHEEPTKENLKNLAEASRKKILEDTVNTRDQIEKELAKIKLGGDGKNKNRRKNKDFLLEDLKQCSTLNKLVGEALLKDKQEKMPQIQPEGDPLVYDKAVFYVKRQYNVKKVLILKFDSSKFIPEEEKDQHKAFDTGNNHHMAIFERTLKDKKGQVKLDANGKPQKGRKGIIVSTLDAARRARKEAKPQNEKDPIIYRDYKNYEKPYQVLDEPEEWKFVFSLMPREYVRMDNDILYRVEGMSQGAILLNYIGGALSYGEGLSTIYSLKQKEIEKNLSHQDFIKMMNNKENNSKLEKKEIKAAIKKTGSSLLEITGKFKVDALGHLSTDKS